MIISHLYGSFIEVVLFFDMSLAVAVSPLNINLTPRTKRVLNRLYSQFDSKMEEFGNDYLYPIQDARKATESIGGGNFMYAFLVLIRSHIKYNGADVLSNASDEFRTVHTAAEDWITEITIAGEMINNYRNIETLIDIINDDSHLEISIINAAASYGSHLHIRG